MATSSLNVSSSPTTRSSRGHDEPRHVEGVRERHGLVAVAGDAGSVVLHVDHEDAVGVVCLEAGGREVIQESAVVDDRPLEAGRLEGLERGEVVLQGREDGDAAAEGQPTGRDNNELCATTHSSG